MRGGSRGKGKLELVGNSLKPTGSGGCKGGSDQTPFSPAARESKSSGSEATGLKQ